MTFLLFCYSFTRFFVKRSQSLFTNLLFDCYIKGFSSGWLLTLNGDLTLFLITFQTMFKQFWKPAIWIHNGGVATNFK